MSTHTEPYLNISDPVGYDNSVSNIEYISQDVAYGTNLNNPVPLVFSINPSSDWVLPSRSWLYVEGQVLKSDGTPIQPIAANLNVWPDFALLNNFFPYMFQTVRYLVNDVEIESFNNPGQCTTINNLVTRKRIYNGLDCGWELDTYDGQAISNDVVYDNMRTYEAAAFVAGIAGAPTQAEYATFIIQVFTDFNNLNPTKPVTALTAAQINAVVGNPPVVANIPTVVNLMITQFNTYLDAPTIPATTAAAPASISTANFVAYLNTNLVQAVNVALSQITFDTFKYNTGYRKRKDFIFNPVPNVMLAGNQGMFSVRIPLSYIFNFCQDYQKVMFNCKHEIQLMRQTTYMPVFKETSINYSATINLTTMRWYMPKITPSLNIKELLYTEIKNGIEVDLAFMNKKIDQFTLTNSNLNFFSAQINYSAGVEKPRYLVAGFQTVNTADPNYGDPTNYNFAIFNGTNLAATNGLMIDVNYVNVKINGTQYQLMDYQNNFNQNKIGRWYNEYKKFKQSYSNDFDDEDMIDIFSFRNIYRLYVFDISKQVEDLMQTGVANVSLDFNFNAFPVAPPVTMQTNLFVVSYFDRVWRLKSDGSKQVIIK